MLKGVNSGDKSGISVSAAGDVNGDGIDDLLIGAQGADPNAQDGAGESYVVFGRFAGSLEDPYPLASYARFVPRSPAN